MGNGRRQCQASWRRDFRTTQRVAFLPGARHRLDTGLAAATNRGGIDRIGMAIGYSVEPEIPKRLP